MTGYKREVDQGSSGGSVPFISGTIPANILAPAALSDSLVGEDPELLTSEASVFVWSQRLMKSPLWKT